MTEWEKLDGFIEQLLSLKDGFLTTTAMDTMEKQVVATTFSNQELLDLVISLIDPLNLKLNIIAEKLGITTNS